MLKTLALLPESLQVLNLLANDFVSDLVNISLANRSTVQVDSRTQPTRRYLEQEFDTA